MIARLPIIAKPHKSGDAKPDIRKLTDKQVDVGQDRSANRKANTGKPVGAKLWVYGRKTRIARLPKSMFLG